MLTSLLEFLIVCWMPGAVLFRAPVLDRARREALPAEERLFWQVIISITISLSLTMVLAGLERYTLSRLIAANLVIVLTVVLGARTRLRMGPAAARAGVSALVPILLVGLCAWRFSPPSEYVMGGKDPGTYMNEGIQIAQRGSLRIRDETVATVPAPLRDLFFPSHENPHYYSLRYMGFFIQDPDAGLVVGQFPHLYPASIAIAYGLDGLTGARRAGGWWATLGVVALYFLGIRLVGRAAAAAAAALLALHVLQVWYAVYPNSEVMMQALLLAALLATERALQDDERFFAPLAGVLLGLQVTLRVDIALALAAAGAVVALGIARKRAIRWSLIVPAMVLSVAGVWYLMTWLPGYAYYPVGFTRDWVLAPLAAATVVGGAGLLWVRARPARVTALERWLPRVLVILALAALGYGWFFRTASGRIAIHDAEALRTYTRFYLTTAALIAAAGGYALVVTRRFWHAPATILTITAFAAFFFYKIRVVPEHFWMGRRLIPVILPAVLLLASGFALSGLSSRSRVRRLITSALGVTLLVLLANHYLRVARPVVGHVEYAGMIPQLEKLAAQAGDDDLIIVESRDASDIHVLGLPLTYIYNRHTLLLASPVPHKDVFASFLVWAHTRYRRVLFLGSGGTDLLSRRWSLQPVASERFTVPEYETTSWNTFPRVIRQKEFDYGIYEFRPPRVFDGSWFDLDVGANDDLHVVRFHSKEETEGQSIRWSRYNSWIVVTPYTLGSRTVTLWMSDGGRPDAVDGARVSVYFEDQLLGTASVETGFRPYTFPIPAELDARAAAADAPRLRLQTNLWNPREALGSGDDRELGVMVERVRVR